MEYPNAQDAQENPCSPATRGQTMQKEVDRLRSLNESLMENGNDLRTRCQKAEARIKELQDLIDKPPEEADWVADYHLLQSALDGPIIDAARKWHAAYRKAQNSNLMRAKEVERLRAEREVWIKHYQENSQQAAHIQELEGSVCCGKQTWEATEERIDGLLAVVGMLNTEVYDTAGPLFDEKNRLVRMLRGMLEEAEHGTKNRR